MCIALLITYWSSIIALCIAGDQGREVLDKGETEFDHSTEEFLQKGGFQTDLSEILSFLRNIALPSFLSFFEFFLLLQIDNSSMN